jgi:hypothetical protein
MSTTRHDRIGGDRTGGDRTGGDRTGGDRTGGDRTGGDRAAPVELPRPVVERATLQMTMAFRIANVQELTDTRPRKLEQDFAGLWKVAVELPSSRPRPAESHLRVCVSLANRAARTDLTLLGTIIVTLNIESLDGDLQKLSSYELDLTNDDQWFSLITWAALWTDNTTTRDDDGFRLIVNLSSVPPPRRPTITDPLILKNVLEIIEGQDVIDTKFLVFSERRVLDGKIGAAEPLPVYANSLVMRRQCDYFDTRQSMLISNRS